jgi:hypothetical protein
MGEAGSVVAELRQNPGAEDDAKSGKTAVDLGLRGLLKLGANSDSRLASSALTSLRMRTVEATLLP